MELRKDYILDRWVFLAESRKARPHEFKKEIIKEPRICYFCPGNEHLTPPEIGRVEENGEWRIRLFENKFPVVNDDQNTPIQTDNKYFTHSYGYGQHEIIVETQDHGLQLWDLSEHQIKDILKIYNIRIDELAKRDGINYVLVFKNHGKEAGTSLIHSHSQVVAVNIIPTLVQEEVNACKKYDSCPYCEIVQIERQSDRRCFENETFVAFTPYASRFNYEIWIYPKRHVLNMNEFSENEMKDLSNILSTVLGKLKEIDASFNYFLHYAPYGEDLHFHIEITPRMATWAGFEFSSDATINSVSPEQAAQFYRGEL